MEIEGLLKKTQNTWILSEHKAQITTKDIENIQWIEEKIQAYDLQKPILKEIEEMAHSKKITKEQFKIYLFYLQQKNKLVFYKGDYIHQNIFSKIKQLTINTLKENKKEINLSEFRQLTHCTKKMIPIFIGLLEVSYMLRPAAS